MASGDSLVVFTPASNNPPAINAATFTTSGDHLVLAFDASSTESALFGGWMPNNYASGGLTVTLTWTSDTGISSSGGTEFKVRWDADFERHVVSTGAEPTGGTRLDASDFTASPQSATGIVPYSYSKMIQSTDVVFTDGAQIDSLEPNESFRLRVRRDHDHADDNLTGDAFLVRVVVAET